MSAIVLSTVIGAPFGVEISQATCSNDPGLSLPEYAIDNTTCSPISKIVLLLRFTVQ